MRALGKLQHYMCVMHISLHVIRYFYDCMHGRLILLDPKQGGFQAPSELVLLLKSYEHLQLHIAVTYSLQNLMFLEKIY